MKVVHNESGDCSCAACINKSSRTSLKRLLRVGSRPNKLHYGKGIPSKDKKLLDKLVATRKEYDKLRSELLVSSSGDRSDLDTEGTAVLDLVRLVDKGEMSEHSGHNPLGECCSCCVCESLRGVNVRKRHRHGRAHADSSRSSAVSRHKDPRRSRKVHYDAKQVHSLPCTCTAELSGAVKKRSRERLEKMRYQDVSTENDGGRIKRANVLVQKIKRSRSKVTRALKNEARKSTNAMRKSKSRFQLSNSDISSEVVRVAREKIIRQSKAERKRRAKNRNLSEDLDGNEEDNRQIKTEVRRSSQKVAELVKDSKTKLKESVDMLAQRSVEKIKKLETKRKLAHHMCDCPEVAAGLIKMAKQNLNGQNLSPEEKSAMDNEIDKALDDLAKGKSKTKMNRKVRAEVEKSGQRIADLVQESKALLRESINAVAQKSAAKIKQLDAKRKAVRAFCECAINSLNRRERASAENISKLKQSIHSERNISSKKLSNSIKTGIQRSVEKLKRTNRQLSKEVSCNCPPQQAYETVIEIKKGFRIRKDSKTKYQEALVRKKELKNWECDPPCFPEECVPQECYEKILLRNEQTNSKAKSKKNKATVSSGASKGTIHDVNKKKGSTDKAKRSSNSSCQCEKINSFVRVQTNVSNPVIQVISTKGDLKKSKKTSAAVNKKQKNTRIKQTQHWPNRTKGKGCLCPRISHSTNSSQFDEKVRNTVRKPLKHVETGKADKVEDVESVHPDFNEVARTRNVVRISSSLSFEIEFSKYPSSGKLKVEKKANETRSIHQKSQAHLETEKVLHRKVKRTQKTGRIKPTSLSTSKATKTGKPKYEIVNYRSSSTSTGQMKSASSVTPRSRGSPTKAAQVGSKNKETKGKIRSRSAVRIGSTCNFNIEFYKENQSAQNAILVNESPAKPLSTPKRSTSMELVNVEPKIYQKIRTRNERVQNKSARSYRSNFSENSNVSLKKTLKRCLCVLKLNKQLYNKQKTFKKIMLSRGTLIGDQSNIRVLKSSGTGTKGRKLKAQKNKLLPYECECALQRELKYRSKGSSTLNRKPRSTSSFPSKSVTSPKNKQVQSVGLIRENKKKPLKSHDAKVVSNPGNAGRQAVRIGSNFTFSIEFSKENASETPVKTFNHIVTTKTSGVKRKGSGGEMYKTNPYKMSRKSTRMEELTEGRASYVMGAKKIDHRTTIRSNLKRCFCTLNLSTIGKNRHSRTLPKQQNYTIGRITVENQTAAAKFLTTARADPVKTQLCQSTCELSGSSLYSERSSITGHPFNELIDLKYFNMVKSTSICLLPKPNNSCFTFASFTGLLTFSSSYLLRNTLFNSQKDDSLSSIRDRSLKRCFCAFDLLVPHKNQIKSSECNLGISASSKSIPIACQSINHKSKRSKLKLSNCIQDFALSVSVTSPPNKHTNQSEAQLRSESLKLSTSPFAGVHTVYRQALLPYECEPNICVPGECDPHECLKLIKKRTKDGRTQSNAGLRKSVSTDSNVAHMNEGIQINRDRGAVVAHRNHGSNRISNDTTLKRTAVSPSRQAVRISSNFKFNVEFSKGNAKDTVPEQRAEVRQVPINRDVSIKQRRDSGYQNIKTLHNTHSQMESDVGEKSTMTTSLLKRCFCTAKFLGNKAKPPHRTKSFMKKCQCEEGTSTKQKKKEKIKPQKETSENCHCEKGSSTKKKKKQKIIPHKETSETGSQIVPKVQRTKSFIKRCRCILKNMKYRSKVYTDTNPLNLDHNECEPGFCVPGACDPYVCLERIEKRKRDSSVNTETLHKRSKAVLYKSYKAPRAQKIQTIALRDNTNVITEKSPSYQKPERRKQLQFARKEYETEQEHTGRQAVKIGSNFSFSVEFYKDSPQPQETVEIIKPPYSEKITTRKLRRRRRRPSTFTPHASSVSVKHGTSDMNVTKTKKIQSTVNTATRCFCTKKPVFSVNIPPQQRNLKKSISHGSLGSTKTALGTFLKRCQCIFKFKSEKKQNAAPTKTSTSTKMHEEYFQRPYDTISRTTHTSTNKYKPTFQKLEPYECTPGGCVPGECDPYECLKAIKQRERHSKGSGTNPMSRVDRGSVSNLDFLSRGTHDKNITEKHRKHRNIEVKERPKILNRDIKSASVPNRQAVRIGSNFSFNIEFYKDDQSLKSLPMQEIVRKKPTQSKSVGNGRVRYLRDSNSQADGIRTEDRSVGTRLDRCFCTLNLQKYKIQSTQINLKNKNGVYYREKGIEANLKKRRESKTRKCFKACGNDCPKSDECVETVAFGNRSAYTHPEKQKYRTEKPQSDGGIRVAEREHIVHRDNRDSGGHRQAVRIGSNFSFNVEFFKDDQQGNEGGKGPTRKLKAIKNVKDRTHTEKGAGEYRDHRNAESQIFHETKNTGSGTDRMLKRCFCTLKLQQKQSHKQVIKPKYPKNQKVYNFETRRINTASVTKKQKLYSDLKPSECEPGVCVPGECNPYKCLERIKKRNKRSAGTRMERRSFACSSTCPAREMGTNTTMQTQQQKTHRQDAVVEVPRFTNIFGNKNVQSVKIGSNFNFNIEFYKECTPAQTKYATDGNNVSSAKDPKIKKVHNADDTVSTMSKCTRNTWSSTKQDVKTENKGTGVGNDLKRCFCTLKFQNQSPQPKHQRVYTVGRVAIEDDIRNYYKKPQLPVKNNKINSTNEMTTIYPYTPKKFRNCTSKTDNTLLQSSNKYKVNQKINQPTSIKEPNHLKIRETPITRGFHSKVDKIKKPSSSFGILRFLHHVLSSLIPQKNTVPKKRLDLTIMKDYNKKKLHTPSAAKRPTQRLNKSYKSSKSDRQPKTPRLVPAKKSKSLKFASEKKPHQKQSMTDRMEHYSRHQSGDARQLPLKACIPKDYKYSYSIKNEQRSILHDQKQYKKFQGKGRSPYSKQYLVGYSLKSVNRSNQLCDACKMVNCNCTLRKKIKQQKIKNPKELTKNDNPDDLTVPPVMGKKGKMRSCKRLSSKYDCNNTLNIYKCPVDCKKGYESKTGVQMAVKSDASKAPVKGKPTIQQSQYSATDDPRVDKNKNIYTEICKEIEPIIRNILGRKHDPVDSEPLFVVNVNSSDYRILNREETLENMIKWNKRKKTSYVPGKKHKKCVCGSEICKQVDTHPAAEIAPRIKVNPCTCGSDVCARQSERKAHTKRRLREKKGTQEVTKPKKKPKEKTKIKPKSKPKPKKEKKKKVRYDSRLSIYDEADKRRHAYHKRNIRDLDYYTKQQTRAPSSLLIAESVVDVASLGKYWIAGLARKLYRTVRHPVLALKCRKENYNTGTLVTQATIARVKRRLGNTSYFKNQDDVACSRVLYTLKHLAADDKKKKKIKEFKPPRPITEAERAAQCNIFLSSLRRKRCLWVYDRCPSFYPHCMSMLQLWKQFTEVLMFLLAIVVWSPCILCVEVCRGLMCCTFCTQ